MKVLVGMSGGVDSGAAAAILIDEGHDVSGATLRLWAGEGERARAIEGDAKDARAAAARLGISHYVFDYEDAFRKCVVDNFISEYRKGRTPNPCIICNRFIKFELLLENALKMGFDAIATGHYARIEEGGGGRMLLFRGGEKDQSYALYALTQRQLRHTLMPLGGYTKEGAREIARAHGLENSQKPDSQEICFAPDGEYAALIERAAGAGLEGDFLDTAGNIIGRHKGIYKYTIGQRKGLGTSFGGARYVVGIDAGANTVTLGTNEECYSRGLVAGNLSFIPFEAPGGEREAWVKIRYNAPPAKARLIPKGGAAEVLFDKPQRAVTPGQAAVFYEGDMVLGGGVILSALGD